MNDSAVRGTTGDPDKLADAERLVHLAKADSVVLRIVNKRLNSDDGHWSALNSPSHWSGVFGVSPKTFVNLCKSNKLRHQKISDRLYRIDTRDLPYDGNI